MLRLFLFFGEGRIYEPALPEETTLCPSLSAGHARASHLLPVPALPGLPVPQPRIPLLGEGWPVPPNRDAEDESEGGTAGWTVKGIPLQRDLAVDGKSRPIRHYQNAGQLVRLPYRSATVTWTPSALPRLLRVTGPAEWKRKHNQEQNRCYSTPMCRDLLRDSGYLYFWRFDHEKSVLGRTLPQAGREADRGSHRERRPAGDYPPWSAGPPCTP